MDLARLGTLAIAAALLFAARRFYKVRGEKQAKTRTVSVVLAFVAGLAFLATIAGSWAVNLGRGMGGWAVGLLIACIVIILVDWLIDKKPDAAAFWAAFVLGLAIVVGWAGLPKAVDQVHDGGNQVISQMNSGGK